ncbi:hypothetical protein [Nonomuraea jiangxiensis]|uniref:Gram-positive cocci surface proteins LPxTG domain-containing protein n=1 Tax=Nonomuraea jiangxiensis TaxID=633440 RepID=A0A1G8C620_9ACTN|nr:hypothetical protein [Nonomuraea jiangxiensis]SDH40729.1 hypothetical protein SAMN05421869_102205 [Nonomuraea jiangxiensis]
MARARLARARRFAAAGAVTAFVIAGLSLAGGTASAQSGPELPDVLPDCLIPLRLPLLCDDPPEEPDHHEPQESWTEPPPAKHEPEDRPPSADTLRPWRPAGEDEHRVPRGHPETGGGGLAPDDGPAWPFALGGAALLAGAGLTGYAVRRKSAA